LIFGMQDNVSASAFLPFPSSIATLATSALRNFDHVRPHTQLYGP